MSGEIKRVFTYQPEGIPAPYDHFIRERNGNIAVEIGKMLGVEVHRGFSLNGFSAGELYCVPATPLIEEQAESMGVQDRNNVYGTVVRSAIHTFKSQLHQTPDFSGSIPYGYSQSYAREVRDVVLPGGVAFTEETALFLFDKLRERNIPVLLKDPGESDFMGQHSVESEAHLLDLLASFQKEKVSQFGLILEAKLADPKTISVGQIFFDGETYSMIAEQKDINHAGRMKFGGGRILVTRGEINNLFSMVHTSEEKDAIEKSEKAHEAFGCVDPVSVSRLSFDVVRGQIGKIELSGVTDITARVGGYTPAEVLAVKHLRDNPEEEFVKAKSELIYDPKGEHEGAVFLDHNDLKIVARLVQ